MKNCQLQVTAGAAIFYPVLYFFDSTGWFSALLPAVLAHEAGHALLLRCCGASIHTLRLEITGLCMECSELFDPRQVLLCAAAGPAAGFLWALIAGLIPGQWACMSRQLSIGLSLCNLLPVMPLDGGRILLALTGSESILHRSRMVALCGLTLCALWFHQWHLLAAVGILSACRVRA